MEKTIHVFVYGTLRKGYGNHRLLENAEFVGNAKTLSAHDMYASGIPFVATTSKHNTPVVGEVYKVDEAEFKRLDRLEGYPSFYNRIQVKVRLANGRLYTAWMYVCDNHEWATLVMTGDYKDYAQPREYFSRAV